MAITPLPTPPTSIDPVNFSQRADAFLAALPTFASEANNLALEMGSIAGDYPSVVTFDPDVVYPNDTIGAAIVELYETAKTANNSTQIIVVNDGQGGLSWQLTDNVLSTIQGRRNGLSADTGKLGERITAEVLEANAVSLTTNTFNNICNLTVPAGVWRIEGCVVILCGSGTILNAYGCGIGREGLPPLKKHQHSVSRHNGTVLVPLSVPCRELYENTSSQTGILFTLTVFPTFSAGTATAFGEITATRIL